MERFQVCEALFDAECWSAEQKQASRCWLGAQKGEYDNYEKHQKQLASDHFSTHYGSFGVALLQLPRNDLIRYSSLRYIARAFREYLCFGGDDPAFKVPYGSPAFERLAPDEKSRIIDEKFIDFHRSASIVCYRGAPCFCLMIMNCSLSSTDVH